MYTERADGKRDVAIEVSIGRPLSDDYRVEQKALIDTIEGATNTTTIVYHGQIYEKTVSDAVVKYFKGKKYYMKIASVNQDFPDSSDVTGTISFSGAGSAPETIAETAVSALDTE